MANRRYVAWYSGKAKTQTPLSEVVVGASAFAGDHTDGKHGVAKDVRGAKKFVHSRVRFHENAATKRLMQEERARKEIRDEG